MRLQFTYEASFDTSSTGRIRDAFEVALVDAQKQSLVNTVGTSDAYFNHTEGLGTLSGQGVTVSDDGAFDRVTLDLSPVYAGQQATLVFRLVNNDSDTASFVHITSADLIGNPCNCRWQSPQQPLDTNLDQYISPIDALLVINALNRDGTTRVPDLLSEKVPPPYYDVNCDEYISPLDALRVINYLNRPSDGESEGEGEDTSDQSPLPEVDFSVLSDVSASLRSEYGRTEFNDYSSVLYADVAIRNAGQYATDTLLLVGITHLSDPSVRVEDADGVTPDGIPYYDFSGVVAAGTLQLGEATGQHSIAFYNPGRAQFTYDYVVLGQLNRAPLFTTTPVIEAYVGREYRYDADAADADGDTLTFSCEVGPASFRSRSGHR